MKKIIIISGILIPSLCLYFFISNTNHSVSPKLDLEPDHLYGPDKALYRDVIMTVDPELNHVPKGRLVEYRESLTKYDRLRTASTFSWEPIQSSVAGRIRGLLVNPNNTDQLFGGSVSGGLWKNDNFRQNGAWVPVEGFSKNLGVSCITYDPQNPQIMYLGTGESYTAVPMYRESSAVGTGIYKSTDGGATWSKIFGSEQFHFINDLLVRVENGESILYAGVASGRYKEGIFYSHPSDGLFKLNTDNSWTQLLPNIPGETEPPAVSDIEITANNKLFVGTMRNLEEKGGGLIYSSTDGTNWGIYTEYVQFINNLNPDYYPGRVIFASAPSDGNRVYSVLTAGLKNSFGHIRDFPFLTYLKKSIDGGTNWTDIKTPGGWASLPWHALAIAVDPNNKSKITIGGLDMFVLNNADDPSVYTDNTLWKKLSSWWIMYRLSNWTNNLYYNGAEPSDSLTGHYIHADIHNISFVSNSSDEILISSDGGIFYSSNFSKTTSLTDDLTTDEYPIFQQVNNSLSSTQYYTVALHPQKNVNKVLGGTQDNGTLFLDNNTIEIADMIGGGDGAFCFWDHDDPNLKIVSSYINNYYFFVNDVPFYKGYSSGTFINPADYDQDLNLLYANMGTWGGLRADIPFGFRDSLLIINVNKFLNKDDLGLDTITIVKANTGTTDVFSAVKKSPHSLIDTTTLFLGTQGGEIYKVNGLPYNPTSIDLDPNNQLPFGYISSIDIGATENKIVVTYSNYGVESVWFTKNGGISWTNIEGNLPDIPVRWALFNPNDDHKIVIATESGVWGIEDNSVSSPFWIKYNDGLPETRVDMIDIRKSDSVIVAATHGRGLYMAKLNQGEVVVVAVNEDVEDNIILYPNPNNGSFKITNINSSIKKIQIIAANGSISYQENLSEKNTNEIKISANLKNGLYVVVGYDLANQPIFKKKLIITN